VPEFASSDAFETIEVVADKHVALVGTRSCMIRGRRSDGLRSGAAPLIVYAFPARPA
jgi:hypothetical protein